MDSNHIKVDTHNRIEKKIMKKKDHPHLVI